MIQIKKIFSSKTSYFFFTKVVKPLITKKSKTPIRKILYIYCKLFLFFINRRFVKFYLFLTYVISEIIYTSFFAVYIYFFLRDKVFYCIFFSWFIIVEIVWFWRKMLLKSFVIQCWIEVDEMSNQGKIFFCF